MPYFTNRGIIPLPVASTYVGPGDVATGMTAVAWGGLQAFNAAQATALAAAIELYDNVGGHTTIHVTAAGILNVTEATAALAASPTKNLVGTVYDQSGNGNHFTQVDPYRPTLSLTAGAGGGPGIVLDPSAYTGLAAAAGATLGVPYFYTAIVSGGTGNGDYAGTYTVGGDVYVKRIAATSFVLSAGAGEVGVSSTDSAFHHVVSFVAGSGNGTVWVDTATNSGTGIGSTGVSATDQIGYGAAEASNFVGGTICELGYWSGDPSSIQAALNTNAHLASRWNF